MMGIGNSICFDQNNIGNNVLRTLTVMKHTAFHHVMLTSLVCTKLMHLTQSYSGQGFNYSTSQMKVY